MRPYKFIWRRGIGFVILFIILFTVAFSQKLKPFEVTCKYFEGVTLVDRITTDKEFTDYSQYELELEPAADDNIVLKIGYWTWAGVPDTHIYIYVYLQADSWEALKENNKVSLSGERFEVRSKFGSAWWMPGKVGSLSGKVIFSWDRQGNYNVKVRARGITFSSRKKSLFSERKCPCLLETEKRYP